MQYFPRKFSLTSEAAAAYFELAEAEGPSIALRRSDFFRYRQQWVWAWLPGLDELHEEEMCEAELLYCSTLGFRGASR